ncbi:MAG: YadA-like family protein, partial [Rhodanobacter sp.]
LTVGASTGGTAVDFTGTGGARVLTGVANGVNDSDAVTIAQLKATGLIDYTGKELGALVYDDLTLATATLGGVNGTLLTNLAPGQIASGSTDAINGGQISDLRDQLQSQIGNLDGRVGAIEDGIADGSIGGGGGGGVGNDAGGAPITNVGAGVAPTDAANLGQVNSLVQESLQAANAYTDNRVNALSDSLDNFKNDTNQRFQRLDNRLDRIGAMGAANTQMAINAAGVTNGRGRVAVGVGVQNSKAAMAVGYANTLGERTRMSIGGAFSGSETSVGIGFGVDL